jgi:serine/threonine protein kinase
VEPDSISSRPPGTVKIHHPAADDVKQIAELCNTSPGMQGIVHCGICPTSVLLRGDKSVCLADLFHSFDTHEGSNRGRCNKGGHLDYMPPEMILSDPTAEQEDDAMFNERNARVITPAVDVWQVGVSGFSGLCRASGQCVE